MNVTALKAVRYPATSPLEQVCSLGKAKDTPASPAAGDALSAGCEHLGTILASWEFDRFAVYDSFQLKSQPFLDLQYLALDQGGPGFRV